METVNILSKYKQSFTSYNVYIGSGILKDVSEIFNLDNFSKVIVITDKNIPAKYLGQFEKIFIPSGEQFKNIETVELIWKKMLSLGCDRKSLVINLGGGVTGDMGGFAASCYMRGIDFIQIPTTLLAQVDASVGGKVAVNFSGIKNLIGSFNQPKMVIIDVDTLDSLPDREFISGFGEIIKHGIIADKEYFNFVTSKKPREFNKEELIKIIKTSCEIKSKIIGKDLTEKDARKLVNFAHTIGHALESISLETDNPLLHGEAVSIGTVIEGKISQLKGMLSSEDLETIIEALDNTGLPTKIESKKYKKEKVLKKIHTDKKSIKGVVQWTLIEAIGERAKINQEVEDETVIKALQFISK